MSEKTQPSDATCEITNPFEMVQQRIDAICEKIKI